jgi:hypothetical protein
MAVGQQDGLDGSRTQTELPQPARDENRLADEARIQHHTVIAIGEQKATAHQAVDDMQIGWKIVHHSLIADRWRNPAFKNTMSAYI